MKRNRWIWIGIAAAILLVILWSVSGSFSKPKVGDLYYPRHGSLCYEPFCGTGLLSVSPYEECRVVEVREPVGWYRLSCPDGSGWSEHVTRSPRP
jgi:hypothetical protein